MVTECLKIPQRNTAASISRDTLQAHGSALHKKNSEVEGARGGYFHNDETVIKGDLKDADP